MNSAPRKVVLYGLAAIVVVAVIVALAPHGADGGGKDTEAPAAAASRNSAAARSPAPASTSSSLAPAHTSPQSRPPLQPTRAAAWKAAALATARAFVTWFDRWLAGESTALQAPYITQRYAATLRATVNNVPPGARRQVAAIVSLIPAGMPPTAAHPDEAWIYTTTRSHGALVRFTVEERLTTGHWLVYNVYQGQ